MKCPICRCAVSDPPPDDFRGDYPFCSSRCKLVDLGRWLDGRYQIAVEGVPDDPPDDGQTSPPPSGPRS